MTARGPESVVGASDPDAIEYAARDVRSRTRDADRARQPEKSHPCGFDPFAAFAEWAGPAGEDDDADL